MRELIDAAEHVIQRLRCGLRDDVSGELFDPIVEMAAGGKVEGAVCWAKQFADAQRALLISHKYT